MWRPYNFTHPSESESRSVVSDSLQPHGLYSPWNSSGQNTGEGSLFLLQGIIPTQGPNPGLLHGKWLLYKLSHQASPRKLEWVAYPFSSGSSQPRDQTQVSCIAGGFLTVWASREAQRPCLNKDTHFSKLKNKIVMTKINNQLFFFFPGRQKFL